MNGFLEITILLAAPLVLAASGELLLERSGSIQIGIEGTMLIGAFTAFAVARQGLPPMASLVVSAGVGAFFGLAFALFAVVRRADPILVGTVWNLMAYGVTGFAYRVLAGETGTVLETPTLGRGSLLVPLPVWLAFALPLALHLFLSVSRPGLLTIASGENPLAVNAQGLSVVAVRTAASAFAGTCAAVGGGLLIVTVSPTFVEGVTAGRGFLALALVVFSRWRPLRLLPASLLIGAATALQYRLQAGGGTSIPYAFFLALPGLLGLFALSLGSGRGGAPKAIGSPAP